MEKDDKRHLLEEIEELRIRLKEAEETLSAIRIGAVDAIVVSGLQGEQVFTLTGAERAYRVLIETMNEGAASLNQEGMIIYCNQRLSEMLKAPLEKIIGTPMRQFIRASDLPVFEGLIEEGSQENGKGEVAFINNDGAVMPVLLSISSLQKDKSNIYGITVTDLTAQKHIEDELKRHRDHLEELVKERTKELETSNQQLKEKITERKKSEERLKMLNECFLEFGPDPLENINRLVSLCGKFMGGACALYNRLEDNKLCSWGQWNVPPDYNPVDAPEGHICFDVIKGKSDEVVVIRNLPETSYARTDPNVTRYNLQTYVGIAVKFSGAYLGSLCVVYQKDLLPSEDDKNIMGIIASAIGTEERRRQAEQKVAATAREWQKTFDSIPSSVFLLDVEGRITRCNKATELLLGKTQDEIIGLPCWGLLHGTDRPIPECPITSMKKDLKRNSVVMLAEDRWLQVTVDPILDEVGELTGAVHTIDDVTERKRAEEALRASQQILEGIINAIPVRVFWKDKNLVYLGCNAVFARDAGFADPKEIMGKNDYQMGWREQADLYRSDDRQVLESGCSRFLIEATQTTPEGNTITLLTSKIPMSTSNGEISGVIGTYMDITEFKRAEQALFSSEKKFKDLLETINLVAVMLDCDGNITFCNDYLLHLAGWARDEVLNRNWFELFLPEDVRKTVCSMFSSGISDGTIPLHYENTIITREGLLKLIVWNNSILLNPDGKIVGVASIGTDVTEHRKLEDQLRHAQKMEAVGTLAGGIAHDFNNILNVIIGYGTMVTDKLEVGSPAKEQMNEVLTAADRAANLTKRLLVFSRKQAVEVKPVNINELILGLQKMLVRIIKENIDFTLDLSEKPLMVMVDAGQIEQVLMNLATNAKDTMPEGGRLTVGTEIKEIDDEYVAAYGYGKPGRYALITVADTGQGMDEETRKKIFEPFFTTKGIGEGTGLGLAISYGIMKQHSGYIKVYSELGKGTEFKIYLPLIEDPVSLKKKTEASASVKGGNETILVAEDDAALRKLSGIVLESYGYTVITAEDGEDAITKFMDNRERISLAIIDMIMPKKNGKEVEEAIRKVSPGTKILFASGYTMDIIRTRELTESGFDFILKPVLPRDLLKKVREILDR